jgi:hypothetical protein
VPLIAPTERPLGGLSASERGERLRRLEIDDELGTYGSHWQVADRLEIERQPTPRGQSCDLRPLAGKETAGTDDQDLAPIFYKARKSRVDVINVAGIEDLDFPSWAGASPLHLRSS